MSTRVLASVNSQCTVDLNCTSWPSKRKRMKSDCQQRMKSLRLSIIGAIVGVATALQPLTAFHNQRDELFRRKSHHRTPKFLAVSVSSNDVTATSSYGLYDVQEEMLIKRGELEEKLMMGNSSPLKANKPKGVGGPSKGFGGGLASGGNSGFRQEAKSHANVLSKEGVVRIDNVLSPQLADQMREYVFKLLQESVDQVAAGSAKQIDRFANVLLRSNRYDLTIPLGATTRDGGSSPVISALHHVFCRSAVKPLIESVFTDEAILYELSCLISEPGSQRQVMHPDNPIIPGREKPTLLTCFIALQDVDLNRGPTVFMPRTNTEQIHETFGDEVVSDGKSESPKDELLRTRKTVLGILPKGCCAIFDSRLIHCGTANRGKKHGADRVIFGFQVDKIGTLTLPFHFHS